MYYKIVNTKSKIYQQLFALRTKEIQMAKDNIEAIKQKTGLHFQTFLGDNGQQNFRRVPQFVGFKFLHPENVDMKIFCPAFVYALLAVVQFINK